MDMLLEKEVDTQDLPNEPWNDRELLWRLYREKDWSQRSIAYELDVEKGKVLKGLIENNVLQPWKCKEVLREALEEHVTAEAIADAWNCSDLTIRRWMDEHGLKNRAELTPELLGELYHQQKLTVDEIGDDLGYAPVEVQMSLREHGIERGKGENRFNNLT